MATGYNAGDEFGDDRETMQSGGVREIIVRVRVHDLQFIVLVSIYYIPVFACDAKMDLARIVIASLLALNNFALFSKVSAFVVDCRGRVCSPKPFFINHLARELLIAIIDALITGVMASLRDEMIELAWEIFSTGAPTLEDDFEQHVLATIVCRRLGRERLSTAIWTQIAFRYSLSHHAL